MSEKQEIQDQLHRQDVIDRAVTDQRSGTYNPTNGNVMVHVGGGSSQDRKDYTTYDAAYKAARDNRK